MATVLYLAFLLLYTVATIMGFWRWVQDNHDVLQTLAAWIAVLGTIAAAMAAIVYAKLTREMATTAADQAQTTRRIFEAGHRPYLEIQGSYEMAPNPNTGSAAIFFTFGLMNHGSVPAEVVQWHLSIGREGLPPVVRDRDEAQLGVRMAVFPKAATEHLDALTEMVPRHPDGNITVKAKVNYCGLGGREYWSSLHKVLIRTENAVRYYFVDSATGGN